MPETITIPEPEVVPENPPFALPLEIHPSIDPELAKGLIATASFILKHPEKLSLRQAELTRYGVGCIICHAEALSNWRRALPSRKFFRDLPVGHWERIYSFMGWIANGFTSFEWQTNRRAVERIELFLQTGM